MPLSSPLQLIRSITQASDLNLPQNAPRTITQRVKDIGTNIQSGQVDWLTRFYKKTADEVPDARERMTLALNKAGTAVPQVHKLGLLVKEIENRGLGDKTTEFLNNDQAVHTYATMKRHAKEAMDQYYMALADGNRPKAMEFKATADDLTRRIDADDISPIKLSDVDRRRTELLDSLNPDDQKLLLNTREEYLKLGQQMPDVLSDLASPDAIRRWRAQQAEAPYARATRQQDVVAEDPDTLQQFLMKPYDQTVSNLKARRGVSNSSLDPIIQRMEADRDTLFEEPILAQGKVFQRAHVERARQGAAKEALAILQEAGRPVREVESPTEAKALEGIVSYLDQGKVRHFAIEGDLADLLNTGQGEFVAQSLNIMGKVQRMQSKMITTWNAGFALRNVPKDFGDTLTYVKQISSPSDVATFTHLWAKTLKDEILNEGMYPAKADFYNRGGGLSNLQSQLSETPLGNHLHMGKNWLARKFEGLEDIQSSLEMTPKIATYRFLTEIKGMDPNEAAFISRTLAGSPDFGRKGTASTEMMGLIQFWNPQVQGIAKLSAFKDTRALGAVLLKLTAGYLALKSYNNQYKDDEGNPEINRVPWTERKNNLIFMVPDFLSGYEQKGEITSKGRKQRSYVKLPLGHALKFLLSPIMDAVAMGEGEEFAPDRNELIANTVSGLLPTNVNVDPDNIVGSAAGAFIAGSNPILRYPIEEMMNKYAYLDIPIEGQRVAKLDPEYRYTPATSELAKLTAKVTNKVLPKEITPLTSPERIDHLLRSLAPGVAELPLSVVDAGLRSMKTTQGPKPTILEGMAKAPIMGPMLRSMLPSGGDERRTQFSKDFYRTLEKTNEAVRTFNKLKNEGDPETAAIYQSANQDKLAANRSMQAWTRKLAAISKAEQQTLNSNMLSPEEKTKQMAIYYQAKLNILAQAQPLAKSIR